MNDVLYFERAVERTGVGIAVCRRSIRTAKEDSSQGSGRTTTESGKTDSISSTMEYTGQSMESCQWVRWNSLVLMLRGIAFSAAKEALLKEV